MERSATPNRPTLSARFLARAEALLAWLEGAGLGFGLGERVVYWWKHFGFVKMLGVFIAVMLPFMKYAGIPWLCSQWVSTRAEGYGVEIEIEDWDAELLDLRGVAQNVRVKTRGRYGQEDFFRADSVAWDYSLWGFMKTGRILDEIEVERPTIYVERQLSGRWNWEDLVAPSVRRGSGGNIQLASMTGDVQDLELTLPHVHMTDARMQWVENIPANSGSGVVESTRATVYLDNVELQVYNVELPKQAGEQPLRLSLEGRAGDGTFSLDFTRHIDRRTEVSVAVDNLGAGAIAALVHRARLVPRSGSVTGTIRLVMQPPDVQCRADLKLAGVQYELDEEDPVLRKRAQQIRRNLNKVIVNGQVIAECDGSLDDEGFRTLDAIQGSVTKEAMKSAPPAVRAVAELDDRQLSGEEEEVTQDDLTRELEALGVSDDVRTQVERANAFSRGVRRVKDGFRRLVD